MNPQTEQSTVEPNGWQPIETAQIKDPQNYRKMSEPHALLGQRWGHAHLLGPRKSAHAMDAVADHSSPHPNHRPNELTIYE